jgi:hypothetical protein
MPYAEPYCATEEISDAVKVIDVRKDQDLQNVQSGDQVLTIRIEMGALHYDRWRAWGRRKTQYPDREELLPLECFTLTVDQEKGWLLEGEIRNGKGSKFPPMLGFTLWDDRGALSEPINSGAFFVSTVDDKEGAAQLRGSDRTPGISRVVVLVERKRRNSKKIKEVPNDNA